MQELTDPERARLLRASAALCATAMLLLPIAAHSSLGVAQTGPDVAVVAVPTVAPRLRSARAAERVRDPFRPLVQDEEGTSVRATLLAYASGARPIALVDANGRTRVLMVGAVAFGSRVTYVDSTVVRLADGRSLALLRRP